MSQPRYHPPRQQCIAKSKTTGNQCTKMAIPGHRVCYYHGGNAPQVRQKAAEAIAAGEAKLILDRQYPDGFPPIEDPLEAMMQLAAEAWAAKEFFRSKIEELRYSGAQAGEQLRSEVALWERAMDRCMKVLSEITRLGIAERRTAIQEAQAVMILSMLQRVQEALDLQPEQRQVWAEVVPRELRAIAAAPAD